MFNIGLDDLEDGYVEQHPDDHQEDAHEETLGRTDDFPAASTPCRVRYAEDLNMSPIQSAPRQPEIEVLPRVANAPPSLATQT